MMYWKAQHRNFMSSSDGVNLYYITELGVCAILAPE